MNDKQLERVLADSVQLSGKSIPTNKFNDNEITKYAFGDIAQKYGEFLGEAGINEMPIWLADLQEKPFARKVWFCWLGDDSRSGLDCDGRYLHYGYGGVRGVKISAEGSSKNLTNKRH